MQPKYILWLGEAIKGLERGVDERKPGEVQAFAGDIKQIANDNLKGEVEGWYDIRARADWLKGVAESVLAGEGIHETTEEAWSQYKDDQEKLTNIVEKAIEKLGED